MHPYRREAWRAEVRARWAESRGGVPDRRPGVFEHSRHSVWLLWHLIKWIVFDAGNIGKCKWQNDREGLHFLYKTSCLEKNTQIQTVQSGGSQQEGAGSQVWGTRSVIRGSGSQTRGAGSEIRWDPPPNLTPDDKTKTTNIKRGHYLAGHHQIVNLPISNISFFDICCFSGGMKTLSTLLNVLNC